MRRSAAALALWAALMWPSLPAVAHDLTPEKTKISSLTAVPSSGSVQVAGSATFGGQKLLSLATDPAGDSTGGIREVDLVEAKMAQLDPATGDVNFVFKLADLPLTGGLPEVAEYFWEFRLAPLELPVFRIQGKFSNLLGLSTRMPWFVLHTCLDGPGENCSSTAVTGEMVGSDNEIFVDIPWTLLETKAGRDLAGLRIAPATDPTWRQVETALGFELGSADAILEWSEYPIAFPRVDIGIASPYETPGSTVPADVTPEGDFAASLDTAGLASGPYDVVGTACYGTNCGTYRQRITI